MERSDLKELYYITPIANIGSILDWGILCHASAARVEHDSIADQSVQALRSRVQVPGGARLHGYANLYLNARNAMLYRLAIHEGRIDNLCVMGVAIEVLDFPGVMIADRNAADSIVRFYEVDKGLAALSKWELFANYWDNDVHRSRMQAEVLVPGTVGPSTLTRAYVGSNIAKGRLERVVSRRFPIVHNNLMFFLSHKGAR